MAQLFVFSAPSGAGKTTVVNQVRARLSSIVYSISHTTRPPRRDEADGIHYHFVDEKTFQTMIDNKGFVEWARVFGNLYGTSFANLDAQMSQGLDLVLDLDHQGAKNIKGHYKNSVLIYIFPPSLEVLGRRLTGRGSEGKKDLELRLKQAVEDMENARWFDYLIVNDDLETTVNEACAIITAERCRISRRMDIFKNMMK